MKKLLTILALLLTTPSLVHAERIGHIVDGDTIRMDTGERVRFYGVNSPEMNTHAGRQAKAYLMSILPQNAKIKLIRIAKDKHHRTLAIVIHEGKVLQEIMVKTGHAWVMRKYCKLMICKEWKK